MKESPAVDVRPAGGAPRHEWQCPCVGGRPQVASFKDKDGNDIEMGLHVFFGWCAGY